MYITVFLLRSGTIAGLRTPPSGKAMRATFTATLCLTAALLAAGTRESRADFRVCNPSDAQVRLAFGHNDSRFGWTSRGWWTLAPGACQMVLYGDIPRGNYYVYTIDGASRGISAPPTQTGGTFCVKDENFDLRSSGYMTPQNAIACEAHGLKGVKFRAVEVREGTASYTYSIAPDTVGISELIPLIKAAAQNLERPAPPASPPVAQSAGSRPSAPAGRACQRYPNLC